MRKCLPVCLGLLVATAAPQARGQDGEVAALIKKLNSTFDAEAGAKGLGQLGAKAKAALPDLGKALMKARFQSERVAVADALGSIVRGIRAEIPNLRALIKVTKNAKQRTAYARSIEEIRRLSKAAANDLGDALLKRQAVFADDRLAVTKAIAACGEDAAGKGVKGLAAALQGGFMQNQIAAANALGELGPAARDAIPALQEAARTGFLDVRRAAAEALKKVQRE